MLRCTNCCLLLFISRTPRTLHLCDSDAHMNKTCADMHTSMRVDERILFWSELLLTSMHALKYTLHRLSAYAAHNTCVYGHASTIAPRSHQCMPACCATNTYIRTFTTPYTFNTTLVCTDKKTYAITPADARPLCHKHICIS